MIKKLRFSARRMSLVLTIGFLVLSALGCGGGGGSSSDSGGSTGGGGTTPPATSPNISLSTQQLLFGNVVANTAGLRSADRSVQVTNTGTANLVIGQIAQADPLAPPFSIPGDGCSGVTLAQNASCSVLVRFKPLVPGSYGPDTFDILSNDPDQPSLTVSVSGNANGLNVTINKVETSGYPNIRMIVTVTDGNNDPVTGLLEGDFAVSEEDAGKSIVLFDNTVSSPVSASLVLDYSFSVTPVQDDIEQSAKLFLQSLAVTDEAAVIKFASEVREAIGFTSIADITALENAIDAPYTDSPLATKLYDAVVLATDTLSLRSNDRKCAIVVSDGEDLINTGPASVADLEDVIADAQDKNVFVFTIGLGDPIIAEVLQRMAVETGGQYFETPDSTELNAIYTQISQILGNQYELTFTTAKADGTLNSLKVVATQPVSLLKGEDTESVTY